MRRFSAALTVAIALGGPAAAQSDASSWVSEDAVALAARGGSHRILKTAPLPVAPRPTVLPPVGAGVITTRAPAPTVPTLPSSVPDGGSTVAKSGASAGGDAAYEAFDQGQYLKAIELAKASDARGEAQGATLLGRIYQEGQGVPKDDVQAANWYRRGAELGDANAMFAFGVMLAEGGPIKKDVAGAAKMFEQAASTGHVAANYNLALLFLSGEGKPQNPRRAFAHLQYAAEAGLPNAQYDLATMYATGNGVDSANAFVAADWYEQAANAGFADAQLEFGIALFAGQGVRQNKPRGVDMFRLAAEKGNVIAQDRLALCLAFGEGTNANAVDAAKWYVIAKSRGVVDKQMEQVLAKLSKADRVAAEQAASEWRARSVFR